MNTLYIILVIIGYIVLPFILFAINDYMAGLWRDRLDTNMSLYYAEIKEAIVIGHLFWPVATAGLIVAWITQIFTYIVRKRFMSGKSFDLFYEMGMQKRKQDTDLNYQAEKHLLGKK